MNSSNIRSIQQKINTALQHCDKGQQNAARNVFDELVNSIPEDSNLELQFGSLCIRLGEKTYAIYYFSRTVSREPDNASALALLGAAFLEDGKLGKAQSVLEKAIELQPNMYDAYVNLGAVKIKLNQFRIAAELLERAVSMKPSDAGSNANLAIVYRSLDRYDDAHKYAQKALKLDPRSASLWHLMGLIYADTGHPEEAINHFMKAIKIDKVLGNAYSDLAKARKLSGADSKIIAIFENALKESMSPSQRAFIHFGLGKIYDDCKEWDIAFPHFRQANLLAKPSVEDTPPRKQFKQVKKIFTKSLLNSADLHGSQSSKPVFVVGMPRSGTTLIEQIIASHPQAAGAGELREISDIFSMICTLNDDENPMESCRQHLNNDQLSEFTQGYLHKLDAIRNDADRIVDKMPENFFNLGLIQVLFPNATIIHATRHPLDTCLSCYFQSFIEVSWSFDLGWIGERYCYYREIMDYWHQVLPQNRILTVEYEKLIEFPEAEIRRILNACNLSWDPACLSFNQTSRTVNTSSLWQVRQPIYRTSKQRWTNYAKYLQPLIKPLSQYLSDEDKAILGQNGIKTGFSWNIRKFMAR